MVLFDSRQKSWDGDRHASIVVLQFPPRLSCKIDVSFELRYGINFFGLPLHNASTTLARLYSDALMWQASCRFTPETFESLTRSEPAKSTILSLAPMNSLFLVTSTTVRVKIKCDLLLSSFIDVAALCRLDCALASSFMTCAELVTFFC